MDHLIAKIRDRKTPFSKVLSEKVHIFSIPDDLHNTKVFEAGYNLDDDEWFIIEDFSTNNFCPDFLKTTFTSTEYRQIDINNFNKISYLCCIRDNIFFFQKMSSGLLVTKKWFPIKKPELALNSPIIVLKDYPDALYDKTKDILYFKRLSTISGIFKGIEVIYREATEKETTDFLKSDFLKLENGYNAEAVKTLNRKRIAMATDTLSKYSKSERKSLFEYIGEYCQNVNYDKKSAQFTITNEDDLKQILFGIEERYYTTKHGNQKRLANSVTNLQ